MKLGGDKFKEITKNELQELQKEKKNFELEIKGNTKVLLIVSHPEGTFEMKKDICDL